MTEYLVFLLVVCLAWWLGVKDGIRRAEHERATSDDDEPKLKL